MRFLLIVACAFSCEFAGTHAYRSNIELRQHFPACRQLTGVDNELYERLDSAEFGFDEDAKANSFTECALTKVGVMTDDGAIVKDVILEFVPESKHAKESVCIDECIELVKNVSDKSKKAFRFMRCYSSKKLQE